jgi:hypothetical protein
MSGDYFTTTDQNVAAYLWLRNAGKVESAAAGDLKGRIQVTFYFPSYEEQAEREREFKLRLPASAVIPKDFIEAQHSIREIIRNHK